MNDEECARAPEIGRELFVKILDAGIPVAENIDFVFMLENVSVSFREQMVRHRIGTHVGERFGCDMVPDLADSSWWSQSMRILDMGTFATDNRYRLPEGMTPVMKLCYVQHMNATEQLYRDMVSAGVPMEEARECIPLGATHRITWKVNLAALKHIIGKRGCWILQSGLWAPIIRGMVNELADKIDPLFRNLITPPCMKGDAFNGCLFGLDNDRRIAGDDDLPPCPLYLTYHAASTPDFADRARWIRMSGPTREDYKWITHDTRSLQIMSQMKVTFTKLWQRDVSTGKRFSK
jgi:hypothetical protein